MAVLRSSQRTVDGPFFRDGPLEAVSDALVGTIKPSRSDHSSLILYKKFDAFNGSGCSLRYSSCGTSHHEVD